MIDRLAGGSLGQFKISCFMEEKVLYVANEQKVQALTNSQAYRESEEI